MTVALKRTSLVSEPKHPAFILIAPPRLPGMPEKNSKFLIELRYAYLAKLKSRILAPVIILLFSIISSSTLASIKSYNLSEAILSISFNERSGGAENIEMYVDVDDSGTTVNLLTNQALASNATFVWNDRLVLTETDELFVKMAATTNVDVYCSYIDQQLA